MRLIFKYLRPVKNMAVAVNCEWHLLKEQPDGLRYIIFGPYHHTVPILRICHSSSSVVCLDNDIRERTNGCNSGSGGCTCICNELLGISARLVLQSILLTTEIQLNMIPQIHFTMLIRSNSALYFSFKMIIINLC